ncbi:MAG TPA: DUF1801 domain-containing protein [Steroidobacteraceae bacterium]
MATMKRYATFDDYLEAQAPTNQATIRALRRFVRAVAPALTESVKWSNGCWMAGTEPIAYVYSDVGFVQFGFMMGASLKDPRGLLEGKGSSVRHIKVRASADIDRPAFAALLKQAMRLRRQPRGARSERPVRARSKAQ